MDWFHTYKSNTLAGSGNQLYYLTSDDKIHAGRIYYKVFAGGRYPYSFLFSNIIDSTYFDGSVSHCNLICEEWELIRASVGMCRACSESIAGEVEKLEPLTFGGNICHKVMPGEFFVSDELEIKAEKDEYLCLEIEFRGSMIPSFEASILPVFVKENGRWIPSDHVPFPSMIGCRRNVLARIGFLGDSITQGIGTGVNSYLNWNARVAEAIGTEYSYWNLGLGYGRAADVASGGAWFFKAKQMDLIILCFGINDIGQGRSEVQIKSDLSTIVSELEKVGIKVLIQTLPPFDWTGEELEIWIHINDYIRNTLSKQAHGFFDVVPLLLDGAECDGRARYGGHPNEEGCRVWSDAITPVIKGFITGQYSTMELQHSTRKDRGNPGNEDDERSQIFRCRNHIGSDF